MPKYTTQKEMVPPGPQFGFESSPGKPYGQLGMQPNDPGWGAYDITMAQMNVEMWLGTGGDYDSFKPETAYEMAPSVNMPSAINPGRMSFAGKDSNPYAGKGEF